MAILIDKNKCIGCGKCRSICPGNLIRSDSSGKAVLQKPESCWSCASCLKECPVSAISLYLPPEMDGRGAGLSLLRTGKEIRWEIKRKEEELAVLVTRADEANRY